MFLYANTSHVCKLFGNDICLEEMQQLLQNNQLLQHEKKHWLQNNMI